ncbi:MAG: hypothetical protein IJ646_12350 [Clostridia bacterium]|nr:hypothetical protein [Clostridia bacterium]
MPQSLYELIALGARYVFAALMALIVARAWRITVIDSRRAQTLRRISPETGLSGELVVMEGGEQARRGMKYPVIREGLIGSSRRADIRVRHSSVRRRHAWFQLTPEGLSVRAHAGAPLYDRRDDPVKEIVLKDGGVLSVGDVKLMLILTESTGTEDAPDPADEWFETDPDALFAAQPVLNHRRAPRPRRRRKEENW